MSVTVSSIDVLDEVVRRTVAARDGGRSESDLVNEFVLWRREAPLDGDAAAIREAAIARLRRADNGGEVPLYEAVLADFAWLRGELEPSMLSTSRIRSRRDRNRTSARVLRDEVVRVPDPGGAAVA